MSPQRVISSLLENGIFLTVDGCKLLASPRMLLNEDARDLIRSNQTELHRFLADRKAHLFAAMEVVAEIKEALN